MTYRFVGTLQGSEIWKKSRVDSETILARGGIKTETFKFEENYEDLSKAFPIFDEMKYKHF